MKKKAKWMLVDSVVLAFRIVGIVLGGSGVLRLASGAADVWSFVMLGVGLIGMAFLTVGRSSAAYNTGMHYASWRANGRVVRPGADRDAASYSTSVASDVGAPRVKGMQTTLDND